MASTNKYWTCGRGGIEFVMTLAEARSISHSGPCDDDVATLIKRPKFRSQLDDIDPDMLRAELKEYGAWEDAELQDHDTNLQRILWLAAGDIADGNF